VIKLEPTDVRVSFDEVVFEDDETQIRMAYYNGMWKYVRREIVPNEIIEDGHGLILFLEEMLHKLERQIHDSAPEKA
jgi:hypothetical protein